MDNPNGLKPETILRNGKYRIKKVLGKGSFGITYLALARFTTQGNLGQMDVEGKVAIKEFFMREVNARRNDGNAVEGSAGSVFTNYRQKFRKEAENLSKLKHDNIVRVVDVFDENNTSYYVMEFLEGQNLDEYIQQSGRLEEDDAIKAIKEVGEALVYMHSRKMLHLDIKPRNIMRRHDGRYFLIDFGLSKQFSLDGEPESSTSIGLGTPGYAPLEQSEYKQDGTFPATLDVYALAASMFKMLTGERPPDASSILNEGFPSDVLHDSGISDRISETLKKGMSPLRKNRYQTVRDFLEALDKEELDDEATAIAETAPQPLPDPLPKPKVQSPQPSRATPKTQTPDRAPKPGVWVWWTASLAAAIILVLAFWPQISRFVSPASNPQGQEVVTDSDPISPAPADSVVLKAGMKRIPTAVTDMEWKSPLGAARYTGTVKPDTLDNRNQPVPHGKGRAEILQGKYAGCVYDGEFSRGNFEGKTKYVQTNGDTFEGTFRQNQYYQGIYTIKSSGEYFKGSFKNGQPYQGKWFDKNGKEI